MALLRNREVTILGRSDGESASPNYTVLYPQGDRENVKLSELQLTKQEADEMKKTHGESVMYDVKVIEDKDLQEIRDGQDKKKIEDRQGKEDTTKSVEVKRVMVDPAEVAEKAPAKKNEKK
jgi:hypothetical protein